MTTLLHRLRNTGDRSEGRPYSDMHAAADEIDRLRAKIEKMRADRSASFKEAVDRVCGVLLNDGAPLENILPADECERITRAALNLK